MRSSSVFAIVVQNWKLEVATLSFIFNFTINCKNLLNDAPAYHCYAGGYYPWIGNHIVVWKCNEY